MFDSIILCGYGQKSRPIGNRADKALLELDGKPVFTYPAKALLKSKYIANIYIIGAKKNLDAKIADDPELADEKRIFTLEQKENLAANIWHAFLASIDGYKTGMEKKDKNLYEKVIFALSGDAPLTETSDINQFIERSDLVKYDYIAGMSSAESLECYRPVKNRPGIEMACFNVKEGLLRINNMHLARPFLFKNRAVVQKLYNARYQKNLMGIIRLTRGILTLKNVRSHIWLYYVAQAAMISRSLGLPQLSDYLRSYVSLEKFMEFTGSAVGLRAGYTLVDSGRPAIDIDNEKDWNALLERFDEWTNAGTNDTEAKDKQ